MTTTTWVTVRTEHNFELKEEDMEALERQVDMLMRYTNTEQRRSTGAILSEIDDISARLNKGKSIWDKFKASHVLYDNIACESDLISFIGE